MAHHQRSGTLVYVFPSTQTFLTDDCSKARVTVKDWLKCLLDTHSPFLLICHLNAIMYRYFMERRLRPSLYSQIWMFISQRKQQQQQSRKFVKVLVLTLALRSSRLKILVLLIDVAVVSGILLCYLAVSSNNNCG